MVCKLGEGIAIPIAALIPAIIGAGGAIGGSLLSKGGSSSTPTAATPSTTFNDTLKQTAFDWARGDRKKFLKTLNPVQDYYKTLLQGDRSAVSTAIAPQVNATNRAYDAATKSLTEFGPRGGGEASGNEALATRQAGDIGALFTGARSAGAQGLASIAPLYASVAGNELGTTASTSATGINAAIQQMWLDLQKRQQTLGAAGGIGSALGNILALFLKARAGGGGGGGTGDATFNVGGFGGS